VIAQDRLKKSCDEFFLLHDTASLNESSFSFEQRAKMDASPKYLALQAKVNGLVQELRTLYEAFSTQLTDYNGRIQQFHKDKDRLKQAILKATTAQDVDRLTAPINELTKKSEALNQQKQSLWEKERHISQKLKLARECEQNKALAFKKLNEEVLDAKTLKVVAKIGQRQNSKTVTSPKVARETPEQKEARLSAFHERKEAFKLQREQERLEKQRAKELQRATVKVPQTCVVTSPKPYTAIRASGFQNDLNEYNRNANMEELSRIFATCPLQSPAEPGKALIYVNALIGLCARACELDKNDQAQPILKSKDAASFRNVVFHSFNLGAQGDDHLESLPLNKRFIDETYTRVYSLTKALILAYENLNSDDKASYQAAVLNNAFFQSMKKNSQNIKSPDYKKTLNNRLFKVMACYEGHRLEMLAENPTIFFAAEGFLLARMSALGCDTTEKLALKYRHDVDYHGLTQFMFSQHFEKDFAEEPADKERSFSSEPQIVADEHLLPSASSSYVSAITSHERASVDDFSPILKTQPATSAIEAVSPSVMVTSEQENPMSSASLAPKPTEMPSKLLDVSPRFFATQPPLHTERPAPVPSYSVAPANPSFSTLQPVRQALLPTPASSYPIASINAPYSDSPLPMQLLSHPQVPNYVPGVMNPSMFIPQPLALPSMQSLSLAPISGYSAVPMNSSLFTPQPSIFASVHSLPFSSRPAVPMNAPFVVLPAQAFSSAQPQSFSPASSYPAAPMGSMHLVLPVSASVQPQSFLLASPQGHLAVPMNFPSAASHLSAPAPVRNPVYSTEARNASFFASPASTQPQLPLPAASSSGNKHPRRKKSGMHLMS
jgi:hypothetical protein